MATYNQRALSIFTALLNATPTQSQQDRLGRAFASSLPPEATNAQISEQAIKELRQYALDRVTAYETQSGITALRESKAIQVPIDFPEVP